MAVFCGVAPDSISYDSSLPAILKTLNTRIHNVYYHHYSYLSKTVDLQVVQESTIFQGSRGPLSTAF